MSEIYINELEDASMRLVDWRDIIVGLIGLYGEDAVMTTHFAGNVGFIVEVKA